MSDLFTCIGLSAALIGALIVVGLLISSDMLRDKISDLTNEIFQLRMDLKRGEGDADN